MSIIRIYPEKMNTIASGIYANYNSGQNAISEIWFGGGSEDSSLEKRNSISRIIVKFDISGIKDKINSFDINPDYISSFKLNLTNAIPRDKAIETEKGFENIQKAISSSFDLICFPINKDWDEGRGYDLLKEDFLIMQKGNYPLTGFSNWNNSTMATTWDEPGIYNDPTASTMLYTTQHFSIGDEDINMDITDIVNSWLNGYPNNGICIAYRRDYELFTGNTRYVASFYTDKTNTAFKPFIEVDYNQIIKDDRNNFLNNKINRLFFYSFNGGSGEPTNYLSANTVVIKKDSDIIDTLTPIQLEKGVYYIDLYLPYSKPGEIYNDIWSAVTFNAGYDLQDFSQSFQVKNNIYSIPKVNNYSLSIYGIENGSILSNEEMLRVYCDLRINYSNNTPDSFFDLSYRMIMNNQKEVIPWTIINQTVINGCRINYFNLDTSWLLHNQTYKIEYKINELGTNRIFSENTMFKVLRKF